jgi:hypothetical protein
MLCYNQIFINTRSAMNVQNTLKIEAYSLFEFCQLVQKAVTEGYVFDFESNENAPTAFGSLLIANMIKGHADNTADNPEVNTEVIIEDKPTRGRKPKN